MWGALPPSLALAQTWVRAAMTAPSGSAERRRRRARRNIVHFARALREAGVPLGPGAVLDALAAVRRQDLAIAATSTRRCTRSLSKSMSTASCSTRRSRSSGSGAGLLEKLIAMMSPQAPSSRPPRSAEAGATRVADALFKSKPAGAEGRPVDRPRRALHRVRPGDPAPEGFRADERGGDRGGAQAHPGDGHAGRPAADPAVRRNDAAAAHRSSPEFPPLAAAGRRDRPFLSRAAGASPRRSWRSATFPAR